MPTPQMETGLRVRVAEEIPYSGPFPDPQRYALPVGLEGVAVHINRQLPRGPLLGIEWPAPHGLMYHGADDLARMVVVDPHNTGG